MNKIGNFIKSKSTAAAAVVTTGLLAAQAHAADTGLSSSFTAQLQDGKGEILLIGAAVLSLLGVIVLIRMSKKSAG
ncbi:major capsid protein [Dyella sp. ASV21]|uniref:major capsid protein n=1 Tax=Dyella sp. ASV21 TaxID=2795114 RepID=UPI0018ED86CC|nr:major capsid protein [Dyella sp. ASV21]